MKKIGLVGGIGPASTVDYYLGLIEKTRNAFGGTVYPEIIIDSVDMQRATEYFERGQWDASAALMVQSVRSLALGGAEIAGITANTEHIVWDRMKDRFAIPVVSIVDAVIGRILEKQYKTVLVLGTVFTMKSGLYEEAMMNAGVKAVLPSDGDKEKIGRLIYPNLENGVVIPADKAEMLTVIGKILRESAADAVLLGCTELPLMIKPQDLPVPLLDSTKIHIDAIFREAVK